MPIRLTLLSALLFLHATAAVQAQNEHGPTYATPEQAADDPDYAVQGEYRHCTTRDGVHVIALGNGQFRAVKYAGGLPGGGWDRETREEVEGDLAAIEELLADHYKTTRKSCTLGACPPRGAIVLFDGTQKSIDAHWQEGAKMDEDGYLMQGVTSTDEFKDFTIHLEFRLPYMPEARGQARGNSGYYLQGRYEIQMLDSFGLEGLDNECGGIYSVSRPDVNMCFPPLTWQTYDVDFTAARFDEEGNLVKPAHARVRHNGVVIHNRDLEKGTPGGPRGSIDDTPGPVYLQDHGNPVRYRNIWVIPR